MLSTMNFSTRLTLIVFLSTENSRSEKKGKRVGEEGGKSTYPTWIVQDSLVQPYSDSPLHSAVQ